jgi:hypothetical protein
MDAARKDTATTADGIENRTAGTTRRHLPDQPPPGPEAGGPRAGAWAIAPFSRAPQPETIAIQGFLAPERSFGGVHDLKTVTLDKPSGETDRPETASFRVDRSAILDPGGAVQGTDTERSQRLIREAARLHTAPERISFLRQNRIAVVADYSTTDLGNRHLLVIDRELEIRSAPYEGAGIEFTPQGKGHIEFLKKATLSQQYGSAITGYHKNHDTQAIALRNLDLSLKRRAYEEMLERERAPLLLVAESANGNPQEATLVHIADMKGRTQYSTYVQPERSFPVRDKAGEGPSPAYLGRPGWDILAGAPSRSEILPEIKAFLDSGAAIVIPTRTGPEASLVQEARRTGLAAASVPEFKNTPLESQAKQYETEQTQARPADQVVVLESMRELGSLPETARTQIRNLDFLSVHDRAAAYGEIYADLTRQALKSASVATDSPPPAPEREALLPYPEPVAEKAPRALHTFRVFQRLPEAADRPIDLAKFNPQYRETATAAGPMDRERLLHLMRYEDWPQKITPEMRVAIGEGTAARPTRPGDVLVEIGQDKSRNRAFVIDRLGRPRHVETIPITKGTIPNLSYNSTDGAPNWVAAVQPHPEQPGALMRTQEVLTRSGSRIQADAFFLDSAEGGKSAKAEKIEPGHVLEFGGDERIGAESLKNRAYRLVLGKTEGRLLVTELTRQEAASPLHAFEHVNPHHVFEAYLVSTDSGRKHPGRRHETESKIPGRVPDAFHPRSEVTLALDRKVHASDKPVLVVMDPEKILDAHNQIGGEAPERLRTHRIHASEIAATLNAARGHGTTDSRLPALRALALQDRGYLGEVSFAVTDASEVATVIHVPDATRVRIIPTDKHMAENRIPRNISADVARDNFLAAFYTLEERTVLGAGLHAMAHAGRIARSVREEHTRELSATPKARPIEPPPLTHLDRTILEYKSLPEIRGGAIAPEAAKLILDQVRDAKTEDARSVVNKDIQWREDNQADRTQDKQLSRRQWELGL